MLRSILVFVLVLAVTIVLGVTAHSLFVMQAWTMAAAQAADAVPPSLSLSERLGWVGHDIIGMGPTYGVLVGIALLVAFIAAGLLARVTGLRAIVFAVAGAVAMIVLFMTLKAVLGTVGVFGARGVMGLAAQAGVGALAGILFAAIKPSAA
jgi:hypothetical protein